MKSKEESLKTNEAELKHFGSKDVEDEPFKPKEVKGASLQIKEGHREFFKNYRS